jgi:hypothetical protein
LRRQRVLSCGSNDENRATDNSQRIMMQPEMQIALTVFMARTMDANEYEIKPQKGTALCQRCPSFVTLELSEI